MAGRSFALLPVDEGAAAVMNAQPFTLSRSLWCQFSESQRFCSHVASHALPTVLPTSLTKREAH